MTSTRPTIPAERYRDRIAAARDLAREAGFGAVLVGVGADMRYLAGYPARMTLTKLAETALRAELQRLKEQYLGGQEFPPRDEDLKGGRPIAA